MQRNTAVTIALVLGASVGLRSAWAVDGKEVFLGQKCNLCHAVSSAGIAATTPNEKLKGPDLTGVVVQKGADWTTKFLHKEVELEGKKHVKELKVSDEETKALVGWLEQQKK